MKHAATIRRAALALCALSVSLTLAAQDARGKPRAEKKPAKVVYSVVQVDDDLRVVEKSEIPDLKKQIDRDYGVALADYNRAKKAAAKAKEKFDTPKPKKGKLKVVASNLASKEAADAALEKAREKLGKPAGDKDGETDKGGKTDQGVKGAAGDGKTGDGTGRRASGR